MSITKINNPILPGSYPDPTICRVGKDFYIANSSFSYYPGVPIFHSRDLVHWEQMGHILDRPEQLPLEPGAISMGIFAPTLRWHDDLFYAIVQHAGLGDSVGGNVYVTTAKEPAGPWSEIRLLKGIGGDPSLFWDNDGSAWCSYSELRMENRQISNLGIWQYKVDLDRMETIGNPVHLWNGAMANAWSPEASHIYKKDGWYYLLIAEGGTEHFHAVTVARSRNVCGPFESYEGNPILTHRHLSRLYSICNVGHGDLVELEDGSWYMVVLGSRLCGGYHKNLGRETFIVPVIWENDWPVASPDTGKVEWTYPAPALPEFKIHETAEVDDFNGESLALHWNFLGTPVNNVYRLADSKLYLKTINKPIRAENGLSSGGPPFDGRASIKPCALSFVGRRQQHICFEVMAYMHFKIKAGRESAGLCLMQNDYNQARLELIPGQGGQVLRVVKNTVVFGKDFTDRSYKEEILGERKIDGTDFVLRIHCDGPTLSFFAGHDEKSLSPLYRNMECGFLGFETAGGFVGTYIGMFASGNGQDIDNEAAFKRFLYRGIS